MKKLLTLLMGVALLTSFGCKNGSSGKTAETAPNAEAVQSQTSEATQLVAEAPTQESTLSTPGDLLGYVLTYKGTTDPASLEIITNLDQVALEADFSFSEEEAKSLAYKFANEWRPEDQIEFDFVVYPSLSQEDSLHVCFEWLAVDSYRAHIMSKSQALEMGGSYIYVAHLAYTENILPKQVISAIKYGNNASYVDLALLGFESLAEKIAQPTSPVLADNSGNTYTFVAGKDIRFIWEGPFAQNLDMGNVNRADILISTDNWVNIAFNEVSDAAIAVVGLSSGSLVNFDYFVKSAALIMGQDGEVHLAVTAAFLALLSNYDFKLAAIVEGLYLVAAANESVTALLMGRFMNIALVGNHDLHLEAQGENLDILAMNTSGSISIADSSNSIFNFLNGSNLDYRISADNTRLNDVGSIDSTLNLATTASLEGITLNTSLVSSTASLGGELADANLQLSHTDFFWTGSNPLTVISNGTEDARNTISINESADSDLSNILMSFGSTFSSSLGL